MPTAGRGEIWIVDLGMAAKPRPAVILSVEPLDHERALVTYVPRTTHLRGTRFEVAHAGRGFDPGGFDAQGLGSVPTAKLVRRLGVIDGATLAQVEKALKAWLGLG
jgi:mRNA interferase MazF